MSETSPGNRCPTCGGVMPTNAPHGLCPKCLLLGVAAPTESGAGQAQPTPPALAAVAAAFPQLEILEFIGRGGMGCVFKARQPQLNRFVALKILPEALAQDAAFAARFANEAQALAALNHPNIVTVHDSGQSGGFFYLLMEFVDGANLRQALRAGRFTPEQALAIVPPICDALQFAHEHGIVHRDIKPENVLLDKAGRVKIADFGIAKMLGGNGGHLTRPSSFAKAMADKSDTLSPTGGEGRGEGDTATQHTAPGTPQYMAPEQRTDSQRADHRADIYSLGVVLYEMLTGELPARRLEPPSRKVQIDVRLDEVVLRALEKSPELRWQTAAELRTQVETIATAGSGEPDKTRDANTIPGIPRQKNLVGVLVLCAPPALFAWFVLIGYRVSGVDLDADAQFWNGLIGFPMSAGFGALLAWLAGSFQGLNEATPTNGPRRWSARAIAAAVLLVVSVLSMGGGMVMLALVTQERDWNPSSDETVLVSTIAGGGLLALAATTILGWSARKQIQSEPLRWRGWGGASAAASFWPGVATGLFALSLPVLIFADRDGVPPHLTTVSQKAELVAREAATNSARDAAQASPRKVVDQWLAHVKVDRTKEMWDLTTRESGGAGSVDLKNTWEFDKIKAYSLAADDALAMVVSTGYKDNAGQERMIVFSLIKRDGRWLIRENAVTTPEGAESRIEGFTAHPGVKYDVRREDIIGRWSEAFFSPAIYSFSADGNFSMSFRVVGGSRTNLQGLWRLEEDRLTYKTGAGSTTGHVVRVREDFIQLKFPDGNLNSFHRMDGATRASPSAEFSPVVEATLSAAMGSERFLTLDDGGRHSSAPAARPTVSAGLDAQARLSVEIKEIHNYRLEREAGIDQWERTSAEDLKESYRRSGFAMLPFEQFSSSPVLKENLPMTFLLPGTGFLQVIEIIDGKDPAVKIRYKLLKEGANSMPTVMAPATTTVDSLPPVVVRTEPASGARDVAPGIVEIRVRFSKEMTDGSWSWTTAWAESTPETMDRPKYEQDHRTCVITAKLEPARTYAWWLNSEKFRNFKDKHGNPSVPYLLIFRTRDKEGSP